MAGFGNDGVRYKIVFDKDVNFFSWNGQAFYFKKDVAGYVPHWEIGQAKRRGAKVIEMEGTPAQKVNLFYGGFDGVA